MPSAIPQLINEHDDLIKKLIEVNSKSTTTKKEFVVKLVDISRELVKSVLKEGGNIQDLYYNEEGRLSMPTAVTPPPLVTQVNNNNQNTTHQNQVNVSNLAVNAAQIFGR